MTSPAAPLEVHGVLSVVSRGEARHEVLQVIVEAGGATGAVLVGRHRAAAAVYRRDGRDPDAWQFVSAEQVADLASPVPPNQQRPQRWLVTHVAFWRTTEDPT